MRVSSLKPGPMRGGGRQMCSTPVPALKRPQLSASTGNPFAIASAAVAADAPFKNPLRELSIMISVPSRFCGRTAIVLARFSAQRSTSAQGFFDPSRMAGEAGAAFISRTFPVDVRVDKRPSLQTYRLLAPLHFCTSLAQCSPLRSTSTLRSRVRQGPSIRKVMSANAGAMRKGGVFTTALSFTTQEAHSASQNENRAES